MEILKTVLVIVIFFIVTPFTLALAKLTGLSDFIQRLIVIVGILICFAIAYIETKNGGS